MNNETTLSRLDTILRETDSALKSGEFTMGLAGEEIEEKEANPLFARKNSMRNKPCPCGSGKKFKKCCWSKFNEVSL